MPIWGIYIIACCTAVLGFIFGAFLAADTTGREE